MDTLAVSMIIAQRGNTDFALSALPNAPVVDDADPHAVRIRAGLAGLLGRLATVVAPRDWSGQVPTRQVV
jgi:hypothetical protein